MRAANVVIFPNNSNTCELILTLILKNFNEPSEALTQFHIKSPQNNISIPYNINEYLIVFKPIKKRNYLLRIYIKV